MSERPEVISAIAQLRRLYAQMLRGEVRDTAEAARGLLGPSIAALEQTSEVDPVAAAALALAEAVDRQLFAVCPTTEDGWSFRMKLRGEMYYALAAYRAALAAKQGGSR